MILRIDGVSVTSAMTLINTLSLLHNKDYEDD